MCSLSGRNLAGLHPCPHSLPLSYASQIRPIDEVDISVEDQDQDHDGPQQKRKLKEHHLKSMQQKL